MNETLQEVDIMQSELISKYNRQVLIFTDLDGTKAKRRSLAGWILGKVLQFKKELLARAD